MTRRRPRTYNLPDEQLQHLAGARAGFNGDCIRCDDPILPDDRVIRQGDSWIHVRCSSGADE